MSIIESIKTLVGIRTEPEPVGPELDYIDALSGMFHVALEDARDLGLELQDEIAEDIAYIESDIQAFGDLIAAAQQEKVSREGQAAQIKAKLSGLFPLLRGEA